MLCSLARPWTRASSAAGQRCSSGLCTQLSPLLAAASCPGSLQVWLPAPPRPLDRSAWPCARHRPPSRRQGPGQHPCGAKASPWQRAYPAAGSASASSLAGSCGEHGEHGERRAEPHWQHHCACRGKATAPSLSCHHTRPCRRQRAISGEWHGTGHEEQLIEEERRQKPLVHSSLLIVRAAGAGTASSPVEMQRQDCGAGGQERGGTGQHVPCVAVPCILKAFLSCSSLAGTDCLGTRARQAHGEEGARAPGHSLQLSREQILSAGQTLPASSCASCWYCHAARPKGQQSTELPRER